MVISKRGLIDELKKRYKNTNFGIQEDECFIYILYDNPDLHESEDFLYDILDFLKPILTKEILGKIIISYDLLKKLKEPEVYDVII